MRKLTIQAPWNDSVSTPDGFTFIPWTAKAIAAYEDAGGWFKMTLFGYHPRYNLAPDLRKSRKAPEEKKVVVPSVFNQLLKRLEGKLTKAERAVLIAQLEEK